MLLKKTLKDSYNPSTAFPSKHKFITFCIATHSQVRAFSVFLLRFPRQHSPSGLNL